MLKFQGVRIAKMKNISVEILVGKNNQTNKRQSLYLQQIVLYLLKILLVFTKSASLKAKEKYFCI